MKVARCIWFRTYSDEKVNHESNVESKVHLLRSVLMVGQTVLNSFSRKLFL